MKRFIIGGLILAFFFLLAFADSLEKVEEKKLHLLKDTSMVIKEGTLTSTGATVIIISTNKDELHTYGKSYKIERYENAEWVPVKPIVDNYVFTLEAYYVDSDGILEMDIPWETLYGKLDAGRYRIVKDAAIDKDGAYVGKGYVYAEFVLGDTDV